VGWGVWWGQVKQALAMPRRLIPYASAAFACVALGALTFGLIARAPETGELPFPAERLRTATLAPSFDLVDHEGQPASLEQHRGQIVVLTGVYASCSFTCPMIMAQAKRALVALTPEEQAQAVVLAITMDPERDDVEALAKLAEAQGIAAPQFRLLTGNPERVNGLLDTLGVARKRDPETGVIDHVNLFVLVDRHGRAAYRFSLGERQEQWLISGMKHLLRELRAG
jgi:protein SCO1